MFWFTAGCSGIVSQCIGYVKNCFSTGTLICNHEEKTNIAGITDMLIYSWNMEESKARVMVENCFIANDTRCSSKANKDFSCEKIYREVSKGLNKVEDKLTKNNQKFASVNDIKLDSTWNPDVWKIVPGKYPQLKGLPTDDEGKPEQPDMVLRVDPSLPPKGIYSTLLMSALHEGGTRKPVDRFVLYYQMGEKIACGKDNWAKENVDPKQEQPAAVPEKSEDKSKENPEEKPGKKTETDDTPSYTKWKM